MCQARFYHKQKVYNLSHVHLSVTCSCTWWALSKYKVMWRTYMWRLPYENPSLCLAVLLQAFESTLIHKWQLCSFVPGDEKLCCNHSCNPSPFFETTSSAGLIEAKVSCFSVRMAPALLCLHCMLGVPSSICWECHRALHIHRTQNARSSVTLHSLRLPFMPAERSCLLILRSIRLTNKPTRWGVGKGGGHRLPFLELRRLSPWSVNEGGKKLSIKRDEKIREREDTQRHFSRDDTTCILFGAKLTLVYANNTLEVAKLKSFYNNWESIHNWEEYMWHRRKCIS